VTQTFQPTLAPDEREVLREQGAYTSGRTWKLGQFCLTDKRLLFGHMNRQFLEIDLERVEDVRVQKKAFMLTSKPCLVLAYSDGAGGRAREAWIVNGHVEKWQGAIAGLLAERGCNLKRPARTTRSSTLEVRASNLEPRRRRTERRQAILAEIKGQEQAARLQPGEVAEVARLVDQGSATMLWHFWKNRHHSLNELQAMLGEASHMGVLVRIREVINPAALHLLGKPILVFERSRMDYETGEFVLNSWWLNDEPAMDVTGSSQFVDVLDEGDHFLLIFELAGAKEEDIRVEAREGRLSVAVDAAETRYYEETPIPAGAETCDLNVTYRNGILQVRLGKEAM
jgi:HSP20 family molecular chaperone IbpA